MSLITYIDHLQRKNADDLSFYPITKLEEALERHLLITCEDNGEVAGYIWHGPVRGGYDVVITQACVDYDSRRRYLGWGMINELIAVTKGGGGTGIRLRTGSNSDSNLFWESIGFYCTKVIAGGVKRNRDINHWRTDVQQPLFTVPSVIPSQKEISLRSYRKMKKEGKEMATRWSRNHYG